LVSLFVRRVNSKYTSKLIVERTEQQRTTELLRETLIELSEYLRESKQNMVDEEEEEIAQSDWRFMAMVSCFN
jgi:hypothetical protein